MAREDSSVQPSLLLALPDPCLQAVLQCCAADDQRTLFNAARAHSRLQKAAELALDSMYVSCTSQQQADSALMFLGQHGEHVGSIRLKGKDQRCVFPHTPKDAVNIHQLPPSLQPSNLSFNRLRLQLQPGDCFLGVLGAAAGLAALKRMEINSCRLLDGDEALAAALSRLPAGLEHLCLAPAATTGFGIFPVRVLQPLQQLTYLELGDVILKGLGEVAPTLQAMTRLVDLRLSKVSVSHPDGCYSFEVISADVLSCASQLTRLAVSNCGFETGALALPYQSRLRHLDIEARDYLNRTGRDDSLLELPNLQQMPHLTHLRLCANLSGIPAAAFTVLAANSKLQHLDISRCELPDGVWPYIFPVGGLPHLQKLNVSYVRQESSFDFPFWSPIPGVSPTSKQPIYKRDWQQAQAPDSCRIVSCCPGLVSLEMQGLAGDSDQLGSWVKSADRDKLARQVPSLLSEVAQLRHQLSQQLLQQCQQQAAAFKAAQATQEVVATLQQQLSAAQGAAAEAQEAVSVLQSDLAAARAAAALATAMAAVAADAVQGSGQQWQQDVPEPCAAAPSADSDDVASVQQVWLSWRESDSPV